MKTFSIESSDGIQLSNSKLVYASVVSSPIQFTYASDSSVDLYPISCILVSSDLNLNDDYFLAEEVWEARHTPEDKPFNLEHDNRYIIGHIVGTKVVDDELSEIVTDDKGLPSKIHVIANSVLYRFPGSEELKNRIETIISEIQSGKWFVSMECLFNDFDYVLIKDGQRKIVKRDESTAFLTKHLRAYGGSGYYDDYKLGRVLRDIIFCGKGLVKNPANPQSVILDIPKRFIELGYFRCSSNTNSLHMGDNKMSEDFAKKLEEKERLIDSLTAQIEQLTNSEKSLQKKVEELTKTKAELEGNLEEVNKKFSNLSEQWASFKAAQLKAARISKLLSRGLDKETATQVAESLMSLKDEQFEIVAQSYNGKQDDDTEDEPDNDNITLAGLSNDIETVSNQISKYLSECMNKAREK